MVLSSYNCGPNTSLLCAEKFWKSWFRLCNLTAFSPLLCTALLSCFSPLISYTYPWRFCCCLPSEGFSPVCLMSLTWECSWFWENAVIVGGLIPNDVELLVKICCQFFVCLKTYSSNVCLLDLRSLSMQCKLHFEQLLRLRGCSGHIIFDHKNETLSITVSYFILLQLP